MVDLSIEKLDPFWTAFTICRIGHPIDVSIVVYDITQGYSFAEAKRLVDEITQKTKPDSFVALVGTKADLESGREVSFEVSNVAMFIWC